jgi:hypothetical protein
MSKENGNVEQYLRSGDIVLAGYGLRRVPPMRLAAMDLLRRTETEYGGIFGDDYDCKAAADASDGV